MITSLEARIARAVNERLHLANLKEVGLETHITVFGSTGNEYLVQIRNQTIPICACPDFKNQTVKLQEATIGYHKDMVLPICKHILFVFLRVLKFSKEKMLELHTTTFNQDYIPAQLIKERYLANDDCKAPVEAIQALEKLQAQTEIKRKPIDGNDCAICCDAMQGEEEKKLVWCMGQCGNNFHSQCIESLKKFYRRKNLPVPCPLCRTEWKKNTITKKRKLAGTQVTEEEGFYNFREFTKQSKKRVYNRKK